jgi:DNA-binding CsgD family transcriptional regulator
MVGLLEREQELETAEALLTAAGAGDGAVLVLEGAAGAGKTRLLREIVAHAERDAFTVATGRGSELERGFAFGLLRQALEPLLAGREELLTGAAAPAGAAIGAGAEGRPVDPHATLNGLFWLLAALAQRNPLVLGLDDLHWADEPSLRFLAFALGRVESLPVLIAATSRPAADPLASAVAAGATTLRLRALSQHAVRALVAERLGGQPADGFVRACLATSGGNAFLLVELLQALAGQGVAPTEQNARRVGEVSPENVARSVSARLQGLGDGATRVARALATLGDGCTLALAAEATELAEPEVGAHADALAAAGLLASDRPLRFAHPLLRTAVDAAVAPGERLRLHRTAASLLAAAGAPDERIALHLLETEPGGSEETARTLAEAARVAIARGAPEIASRLLLRALEEPPAEAERPALHLALGSAMVDQGLSGAREHLRAAATTATDPLLAARAADALGGATGPARDLQLEQLPLYEEAARAAAPHDRELALALEARCLEALLLSGDAARFDAAAERFRDLRGDTVRECALLAVLARKVMTGGGTAAEVAALVERAARHLDLSRPGAHSIWLITTVLWLPASDVYGTVERALGDALEQSIDHGSALGFAWMSSLRAMMRNARGDLHGAEADARGALESGGAAGLFPYQPLMPLTDALGDQGKAQEGEALLAERGLGGPLPLDRPYTALLSARGRMRATSGTLPAARADLEEALARLRRYGSGGIVGLDVRLELATVLHALGEADAARELADDALAAASAWGAERALGGALRVAGLLRADIELLREATDVLGASPARLWEARAHVDLGATLRRANHRRDSRPALRRGLELAEACGAAPLAALARRELAASGGHVPAREGSGLAELTPSELRVGELAASGLSNPEIAQRLFITIKTVEMHLSNGYRKLGVRERSELPAALAGAPR